MSVDSVVSPLALRLPDVADFGRPQSPAIGLGPMREVRNGQL